MGRRYDPFEELVREIEMAFRNYAPLVEYGGFLGGQNRGSVFREPFADLFDEGDKYVVTIELPGVRKEDIKLRIVDNTLYVEAQANREFVEEGNAIRMERAYTAFRRIIRLPEEVVPEKPRARYRNGILEVEIPKKNPTDTRSKTIPIE